MSPSTSGSAQSLSAMGAGRGGQQQNAAALLVTEDDRANQKITSAQEVSEITPAAKKLPRVFLRVNAPVGPEHPPGQGI